jgi:hypothetical protein
VVRSGAIGRLAAGALLALVALLAAAQGAAARPGATVYSYGYYGTVDITEALPGAGPEKKALAVAVGPDDETVVVSARPVACALGALCWDLYATRNDRNGLLEGAYGVRAGAFLRVEEPSVAGAQREPRVALALAKNGSAKIAAGSGGGIQLARLGVDGSLDPSFGVGGRVATALGAAAAVTGVSIGPEGDALVGGGLEGHGQFLARYAPSGQLEPGFGPGGVAVGTAGAEQDPAAVAVSGGLAYLGFPVCCGAPRGKVQVAAFDGKGSRRRTFEVKVPKRLGLGKPEGISTVLAGKKGAIEVVGSTAKGSFVARLLSNGKPDKSFGEDGIAFSRGLFVEGPTAAVVDKKGGIVLTGWRRDPADTEGNRAHAIRVFRFLSDGRPDPKFGGVRPLLTVVSGTHKVGLDINRDLGVGLRPDGRVLVLGEGVADPREGIPVGPYFGLSLFVAN